jgi:hypothetical protein
MISKPPHRIIGVKLITMDDQELEPAADVEWSLDIWHADGFQTRWDRVIGPGTLVAPDDRDFRNTG